MKSYIKFLLKKYLPFYVVLFAVSVSIFFIYLTAENNVYYRFEGSDYFITTPYSGLLIFIIPLAMVSIFAPIFANTYRYSIKSADVFYQTGKGSKQIRIVNNLTLLISILVAYTAAFLISILVMLLKQLPNAGKTIIDDYGNETRYILFNFGYYLIAYFLAIIVCSLNYFISYFLITRANNPVNSIICLVLGHMLLSVLIMTPIWYSSIVIEMINSNMRFYSAEVLLLTRVPSIISPIAWIANIFEPLIISGQPLQIILSSENVFSFVMSFVCLVIFLSAAGFSIYMFLKEKESSGELAGKPEGRDKLQMIIFHVGAGTIAWWYGMANGLISNLLIINVLTTISSFIMFCALYYVFYGLIRRNFRLKGKDFAFLVPVASVYIISVIIYNVVFTVSNA